jgi:ABC-type Fe3+ transport system permease subunit
MSPNHSRRMSLLDAILMVGSAAVGLGLFELSHRTLFKGLIWIADRGFPNIQSWSTLEALVTCSDITVFLLPVIIPWTFLLILLRMRSPRPSWRRIWRQPGMAACLVAVFAWLWTALALLLAMNVEHVARARRVITPADWAQKYLSDEVFMYVGLAVAAVWIVQYSSGRWRRSADWIDMMGRVVGALWIAIGLVWTLREYIDFV